MITGGLDELHETDYGRHGHPEPHAGRSERFGRTSLFGRHGRLSGLVRIFGRGTASLGGLRRLRPGFLRLVFAMSGVCAFQTFLQSAPDFTEDALKIPARYLGFDSLEHVAHVEFRGVSQTLLVPVLCFNEFGYLLNFLVSGDTFRVYVVYEILDAGGKGSHFLLHPLLSASIGGVPRFRKLFGPLLFLFEFIPEFLQMLKTAGGGGTKFFNEGVHGAGNRTDTLRGGSGIFGYPTPIMPHVLEDGVQIFDYRDLLLARFVKIFELFGDVGECLLVSLRLDECGDGGLVSHCACLSGRTCPCRHPEGTWVSQKH